jgi:uncharacterized damage-inducible protein DinB
MTTPVEPPYVGTERVQLEGFVDDARAELLAALDAVSEEQARARLVESKTTLLGLVKHAAFVERVWFEVSLLGATRASLGLPDTPGGSFDLVPSDTVASVRADFLAACARSRDIASSYSLDDLVMHNRRSPLTLRWVYAHLVREFARHAGHADILREQMGLTGAS